VLGWDQLNNQRSFHGRSTDLPPAYRKALNTDTPERVLPLNKDQLESLAGFLRENVTDPRRSNRTFPCWSLLTFIAMALLAGRDNVAAIHRYGRFLTQGQRDWLSFPRKKQSTLRKVPSYSALRNLLIRVDPHTLAECLGGWLQANLGTLPRALAVDGKWIRNRSSRPFRKRKRPPCPPRRARHLPWTQTKSPPSLSTSPTIPPGRAAPAPLVSSPAVTREAAKVATLGSATHACEKTAHAPDTAISTGTSPP
jgi:hypothetical protein